ncbi:MAG: hypothetical protein WDW38_001858 [Sanguina aurantia]
MSWSAGRSGKLFPNASGSAAPLSLASVVQGAASCGLHQREGHDGSSQRSAASAGQVPVSPRVAYHSPGKVPRLRLPPAVAALGPAATGHSVWGSFKRRLGLAHSPTPSTAGHPGEPAPAHPSQSHQQLEAQHHPHQHPEGRAVSSVTGQSSQGRRDSYCHTHGAGYPPATALEAWEVGLGEQLAGWQQQQQQQVQQGDPAQQQQQQQQQQRRGPSAELHRAPAEGPSGYRDGGQVLEPYSPGGAGGARRGSIIYSRDDVQVTGIHLGARHPRVSSHSTSYATPHPPQLSLSSYASTGPPLPLPPGRNPSMLHRSASIPERAIYAHLPSRTDNPTDANTPLSQDAWSPVHLGKTPPGQSLTSLPQDTCATADAAATELGSRPPSSMRADDPRSASFSAAKSIPTSSHSSRCPSPTTHPTTSVSTASSNRVPQHPPTRSSGADGGSVPSDPRDPSNSRVPVQQQQQVGWEPRLLQGHPAMPRSPTLSFQQGGSGQGTLNSWPPPGHQHQQQQHQQQQQQQQWNSNGQYQHIHSRAPWEAAPAVSAALQKLSEACFTQASNSKAAAAAVGSGAGGGTMPGRSTLSPAGSKSTAELQKLAWGRSSTMDADSALHPRRSSLYVAPGNSVSGNSLPLAMYESGQQRQQRLSSTVGPPHGGERDSSLRLMQKLASRFDSDVEEEENSDDDNEGEVGIVFKYGLTFSGAEPTSNHKPGSIPGRR